MKLHESVIDFTVTAEPAPLAAADVAGLRLGRGFDRFTRKPRGDALLEADADTSEADGQTTEYSIRVLESVSELREALDLSASASFSGLFGIDASAKAGWASERQLNSYSVLLLVKVAVRNPAQTLRDFELNDTAKKELSEGDDPLAALTAFYRGYGDSFLYALKTGGALYACYEFTTTTASEKKEVTGQVKAAAGSWTAAAKFKEAFDNISTNTETNLRVRVEGGEEGIGDDVSPEQLISFALDFHKKVHWKTGHPVPYEYTFSDYQVADGFPRSIKLPFEDNLSILSSLAQLYDRVSMVSRDIGYVVDNRNLFARQHVDSIDDFQKEVLDVKRGIEAATKQLLDNPAASAPEDLADALESSVLELERKRPPQADIEYGQPHGAPDQEGVEPFDDGADPKVRQRRRLRRIVVSSGAIVDGLAFGYAVEGEPDHSTGWHGSGDNAHKEISLDDDEAITLVRGTWARTPNYGTWISTIEFHTDKDRTYGPYGSKQETAEPFEISPRRDQRIFAFHGSAGAFLTTIGAVFTPA